MNKDAKELYLLSGNFKVDKNTKIEVIIVRKSFSVAFQSSDSIVFPFDFEFGKLWRPTDQDYKRVSNLINLFFYSSEVSEVQRILNSYENLSEIKITKILIPKVFKYIDKTPIKPEVKDVLPITECEKSSEYIVYKEKRLNRFSEIMFEDNYLSFTVFLFSHFEDLDKHIDLILKDKELFDYKQSEEMRKIWIKHCEEMDEYFRQEELLNQPDYYDILDSPNFPEL